MKNKNKDNKKNVVRIVCLVLAGLMIITSLSGLINSLFF